MKHTDLKGSFLREKDMLNLFDKAGVFCHISKQNLISGIRASNYQLEKTLFPNENFYMYRRAMDEGFIPKDVYYQPHVDHHLTRTYGRFCPSCGEITKHEYGYSGSPNTDTLEELFQAYPHVSYLPVTQEEYNNWYDDYNDYDDLYRNDAGLYFNKTTDRSLCTACIGMLKIKHNNSKRKPELIYPLIATFFTRKITKDRCVKNASNWDNLRFDPRKSKSPVLKGHHNAKQHSSRP